MPINVRDRTALQQALGSIKRELAAIGGANTPEMKAAGNELAKSIRKQLNVRGSLLQGPHRASLLGRPSKVRGLPSTAGEAPHRINSRLYKSIGSEVVGGVRRVGSSWFTSRLLQFGVDAEASRTRSLARVVSAGRGRRRRSLAGRAHLHIAPRPFMEKALAAALPKMGDVFVSTLEHR